ncbi:ABC-2 family transporter [Roseimicrobium gellanilyticum]|uniref:ABC-2 family transporter n=1 Tax=Roseimicrobium gellanilyticum TaxID=748857 RepID=A0A366HWZ2_9BACT|nr:ABC transporter permease subunit [Roseimicrobium gellanilyticum]RBP48209.1 ABC-2 family transporter [Roseimicrobium gellanilyticum]
MSTVIATPVKTRAHKGFSPGRIWTLATHTATQLLRMRIVAFLAVFCLVALGAAFFFPQLSPEQQLKQLKDWSMGSMLVASVVFSITATALLLPKDLEDRTLYTILSKPVPRYEYLLGKLLGMLLLLFCGLLLMDLIFSVVLWLKQQALLSAMIAMLEQQQAATPENVAYVEASIRKYGLNSGVHVEVWMVFLRASVVTAMTLLISTFASTTLFTIITSMAFTIAGFGVALMREWVLKGLYGWTEKTVGALLAILCPDLGMFDLSTAAIRGEVTLGVVGQLTGYAAMYVAAYMVVSHLFFVEKEL